MIKNLAIFAGWLIFSMTGFAIIGWYSILIDVLNNLTADDAFAFYSGTVLMFGIPLWVGIILHRNVKL